MMRWYSFSFFSYDFNAVSSSVSSSRARVSNSRMRASESLADALQESRRVRLRLFQFLCQHGDSRGGFLFRLRRLLERRVGRLQLALQAFDRVAALRALRRETIDGVAQRL